MQCSGFAVQDHHHKFRLFLALSVVLSKYILGALALTERYLVGVSAPAYHLEESTQRVNPFLTLLRCFFQLMNPNISIILPHSKVS